MAVRLSRIERFIVKRWHVHREKHKSPGWMTPPGPNLLTVTPGVLGYLVAALDAGRSVMVHATDQAAINAACAVAGPMLGGGHA